MSDDNDVLQKADALMRRHRVFVAGATGAKESVADAPDDVPVLTEIVDPDSVVGTPGVQTPVDLAQLREALAFELEAWLDEELPRHVMRVLDGITDQMIGHLSQQARAELLPRLQATAQSAQPSPPPDAADSATV